MTQHIKRETPSGDWWEEACTCNNCPHGRLRVSTGSSDPGDVDKGEHRCLVQILSELRRVRNDGQTTVFTWKDPEQICDCPPCKCSDCRLMSLAEDDVTIFIAHIISSYLKPDL